MTLSVQGHTVPYVSFAFMFVLNGIFSNYVAALQSSHTLAVSCLYNNLKIVKYEKIMTVESLFQI